MEKIVPPKKTVLYKGITLYNPNDYLPFQQAEVNHATSHQSSRASIIPAKKQRLGTRGSKDCNNNRIFKIDGDNVQAKTERHYGSNYGVNANKQPSSQSHAAYHIPRKFELPPEAIPPQPSAIETKAHHEEELPSFPETELFRVYRCSKIPNRVGRLTDHMPSMPGRDILQPVYKLGNLPFINSPVVLSIFLSEKAYSSELELKLLEVDEIMRGHPLPKRKRLDMALSMVSRQNVPIPPSPSQRQSHDASRTTPPSSQRQSHDVSVARTTPSPVPQRPPVEMRKGMKQTTGKPKACLDSGDAEKIVKKVEKVESLKLIFHEHSHSSSVKMGQNKGRLNDYDYESSETDEEMLPYGDDENNIFDNCPIYDTAGDEAYDSHSPCPVVDFPSSVTSGGNSTKHEETATVRVRSWNVEKSNLSRKPLPDDIHALKQRVRSDTGKSWKTLSQPSTPTRSKPKISFGDSQIIFVKPNIIPEEGVNATSEYDTDFATESEGSVKNVATYVPPNNIKIMTEKAVPSSPKTWENQYSNVSTYDINANKEMVPLPNSKDVILRNEVIPKQNLTQTVVNLMTIGPLVLPKQSLGIQMKETPSNRSRWTRTSRQGSEIGNIEIHYDTNDTLSYLSQGSSISKCEKYAQIPSDRGSRTVAKKGRSAITVISRSSYDNTDYTYDSATTEDFDNKDDEERSPIPEKTVIFEKERCVTAPNPAKKGKKKSILKNVMKMFQKKEADVPQDKEESRKGLMSRLFGVGKSASVRKLDINNNPVPVGVEAEEAEDLKELRHVDSMSLMRKRRLKFFTETQEFYQDSILAYKSMISQKSLKGNKCPLISNIIGADFQKSSHKATVSDSVIAP